ncbi:hypothetical protein ACK6D9_16710 [Hoeflea sp. Naph1]|uniref:hypothetical protein n=1 Tax=Hoeflea sp. Naph1 TaxID=3388653 RepID=UPI00399002F7
MSERKRHAIGGKKIAVDRLLSSKNMPVMFSRLSGAPEEIRFADRHPDYIA